VFSLNHTKVSLRVLDLSGRIYQQFIVLPNEAIKIGAEWKAGAYLIEVKQGTERKYINVLKL
jgi:hypothetical protein